MSNQTRKRKRLTIEELRKFKGCEHYSDAKAEAAIETLEKLSILFYELFMEQRQENEREQQLSKQKRGKDEDSADTKQRNVA
jgi:hypothetical protein